MVCASSKKCSTPCGINEILTCTLYSVGRSVSVLNALRHQWNLHPWQRRFRLLPVHLCSTPSGITCPSYVPLFSLAGLSKRLLYYRILHTRVC
jgi:hypothetical protein